MHLFFSHQPKHMKKLITLFLAILNTYFLFAQAPQRMSYQAVIRNSSDALVTNKVVGMRISILQGTAAGSSVYSEVHTPTANANGLVTIEIGGGANPSGNFANINWANGPYFIKTETDPAGSSNYTITGTSQLLSVPYALHSDDISVKVSVFGDTLAIGKSKTIIIPGISNANYATKGITAHSCGAANVHNSTVAYGTMMDQEGNQYRTIQIGDQTWMAENLRTTKYRNNEPILNLTDNTQWANNTTGAYCSYNNNTANDCPYGKLYNWYAVNNANQLCPTGWHVPADAEWNILIANLDPSYKPTEIGVQSDIASGKMKSTGTQYWLSPNTGATNSSGFSALPGGFRTGLGSFSGLEPCFFWSSTQFNTPNAWSRLLFSDNGNLIREFYNKVDGQSVRCLRD
jgi:uncharacterized protein (TIGR02145 family)